MPGVTPVEPMELYYPLHVFVRGRYYAAQMRFALARRAGGNL
jgi:hypothetical protein